MILINAIITWRSSTSPIAGAPQIFHKNFFFSLPGEVFLIKKKKKVFMKNLPGTSNTISLDPIAFIIIRKWVKDKI
jgi:hypothetical protein